LIEATVATVILMIIISSIYGTFRAANISMARMEERADVYQTARVLLDQINSELCSAYQPAGPRSRV
jgi:type II secretory pathway component PulJ